MIFNAVFAILLKFGHALLLFATVRALVSAWGAERYGLWAAFISVAAYVSMFDLGIGYGMRNKVSESAGRGHPEQAESIVRLATLFYGAAAFVAWLVTIGVSMTVRPFSEHIIASIVLWTAAALSFCLSIHGNLLQALGRFRILSLLSVLTPLLWFASAKMGADRMTTLDRAAVVYAIALLAQAFALTVASRRCISFRILGKDPIDWLEAKKLVQTGLQFFLLQVTALVLLNSGNILVYRNLGSGDTTQYDVLNKIYSMFTLGFSVLIGIAWTEISKAKVIGDHALLRRIFRRLHYASFLSIGLALLCAFFIAPISFALTGVKVDTSRAFPFVVLTGIQALAYSSAVFLNAFEALRPQIFGVSIGLPLFFLTITGALRAGANISAVPLATSIAMLPSLIICFLFARRLLGARAAAAPRIAVDVTAPG